MSTETPIQLNLEQATDMAGEWRGCKGCDFFNGSDLAREAWGDSAELSPLPSFAYLWRRFGPPWRGSDEYKDIAAYTITTADPGVLLWFTVSASNLYLCIGGLWTHEIEEAIRKPQADWEHAFLSWWIDTEHPEIKEWEDTEPNRETVASLYWDDRWNARERGLLDRAEPVIGKIPPRPSNENWRSDSGPIGRVNKAIFDALIELTRPVFARDIPINIFGKTGNHESPAEHSKYAGFGVDKEAMDKLIET